MSFIDSDKMGYDEIFKYFDRFVAFEELIFASDSFYRDHTMHCLWVYFLGEYIKGHEEFEFLVGGMEYELNRVKELRSEVEKLNKNGIINYQLKLIDHITDSLTYMDSIRCINALTHDLGYPVKKISKINQCIKEVLPTFGISEFDEFNFRYKETQQKNIEEFINLISMAINYDFKFFFTSSIEAKNVRDKVFIVCEDNKLKINEVGFERLSKREMDIFKDQIEVSVYFDKSIDDTLRYTNDFEHYNHGIMSAFILVKNLLAFQNTKIPASKARGVEKKEFFERHFYEKQIILKAIADHTSPGYQVQTIQEPSAFLVLMDELEEFSRISRANQNRQYINEFCKTNIYAEDGYLKIDFTFDNTDIDNLSPELAFRGRCKRFLTLFDIFNLDPNLKIKLRCIGALPYDKNIYEIEIRRCFANITINGEEKDIPTYLKANQFYSKEEYMKQKVN